MRVLHSQPLLVVELDASPRVRGANIQIMSIGEIILFLRSVCNQDSTLSTVLVKNFYTFYEND